MADAIQSLAQELPEHQTSRGAEFRTVSKEGREMLARPLVQARSQANAENADWENRSFRNEMRKKRNRFYYYAGQLDISLREASRIWWSVVYDDPVPAERGDLI